MAVMVLMVVLTEAGLLPNSNTMRVCKVFVIVTGTIIGS